jgi:hypothetical protein
MANRGEAGKLILNDTVNEAIELNSQTPRMTLSKYPTTDLEPRNEAGVMMSALPVVMGMMPYERPVPKSGTALLCKVCKFQSAIQFGKWAPLEKCQRVPNSAIFSIPARLGDGSGERSLRQTRKKERQCRARRAQRAKRGAVVMAWRVLIQAGRGPSRTRDFTPRSKPNNIKVIRSERRVEGTAVMAAELRLVGISRFSYLHTSRNRGL